MKKIEFYSSSKRYDGKQWNQVKIKQNGFLLEEGLVLHHPLDNNKKAWEITDIATGLAVVTKTLVNDKNLTKEQALAKLEELREKYNNIKKTDYYDDLVLKLKELPVYVEEENEEEE